MGGRGLVRVALATLLLAASAACNSGDGADRASSGAGAGNTVATEPAPTTTTNPYAVPAVIDAAYVNRVLAGLDAVMGDITRELVRTKTVTQDIFDRAKAIYLDNRLLDFVLGVLQDDLRSGLTEFRPNPGNRITTVNQLITSSEACIFVRVERSFAAVTLRGGSVSPQWISLRPLDVDRDPKRYNPTRWGMTYDGATRDNTQPPNPCAH